MLGRRIRRRRDGSFEVKLPGEERDVLRSLAPQLRQMIEQDRDPALRRLFPVAYHADAEADAEYQAFMRGELQTSRLAAVGMFVDTLDEPRLTEAQLAAWMGAVNDLRLVLGTKLDVSEDDDLGALPDDDPDLELYAVYAYLGWLLEQIVAELSGW